MLRVFRFVVVICLIYVASASSMDSVLVKPAIEPILSPETIDVGTFYNGADVQVSADIPVCDGAILVMEAGRDEIKLNRKGRVAGIWLNVAKVTVENVPKVYLLATSGKLEDIYPSERIGEAPFGVEYLRRKIKFICDEPLTGTEFDEFLRLKTDNGAYKMDIGINLEPGDPGRMELSASLPIAPTVPPGTYKVLLYCFKNGEQVGFGEAELNIKRIGFAHLMANLAQDHAALYGLLAIAVAMVVGIVMGVIFDSLPGSGH